MRGVWLLPVSLATAALLLWVGTFILTVLAPSTAQASALSAAQNAANNSGPSLRSSLYLQDAADETPVREIPVPTFGFEPPASVPPADTPTPMGGDIDPPPAPTDIPIAATIPVPTAEEIAFPTQTAAPAATEVVAVDTPTPETVATVAVATDTALAVDTAVPTAGSDGGVATETTVAATTGSPTATAAPRDVAADMVATIVAFGAITTTITATTPLTVSVTPLPVRTARVFDPACYNKPTKVGTPVVKLSVPYIHQVNDIGSADGSWACGPASLTMAFAYYGKLDPWQLYVAQASAGSLEDEPQFPRKGTRPPSTATPVRAAKEPDFASYVTNPYSNNGRTYNSTALDPQGRRVAGLYGTICPTGYADWSKMKSVIEWHGLSSKQISTTYASVTAALKRGHPVLLGTQLTSEGHILLAIGYTANGYLILNDPYGNRFAPGYGRNNGKEVLYRWECMAVTNAVEVVGTVPVATPTASQTTTPQATSTTPTLTPTSTALTVKPTASSASPSLTAPLSDSSNSLYHGRS